MSFIDSFVQIITDDRRRVSSRAGFVIIIVIGVLVIDNLMGFSFHYQKEKNIQELEKLSSIIKDSSIDSTSKAYAISLRNEIFYRKNLLDYTLSAFRKSSKSDKSPQIIPPTANPNKIDSPIKNVFWTYASSAGLYFIFCFITLPLILITDRKNKLIVRIGTALSIIVSLGIMGFFLTWLFSLIPMISNKTWLWNYILNAVLQLSIVALLIKLTISASKKNY